LAAVYTAPEAAYLSITSVVPDKSVFSMFSLHSHRLAEKSKCAASAGIFISFNRKLFKILPREVDLSVRKRKGNQEEIYLSSNNKIRV